MVGIVRREPGPMAGSRVVGDGLGAEGQEGKVELGIAQHRARKRRLIRQGLLVAKATKHSERGGWGTMRQDTP